VAGTPYSQSLCSDSCCDSAETCLASLHEQAVNAPPSHRHLNAAQVSAPTAAATSRQTRIWFQHSIASGMPSCGAAQDGTSVGCQLQSQKFTHFPSSPPPPTPHCRTGLRRPLRRNTDRQACGFIMARPRACHHAAWLKIARQSGASFSPTENSPTRPRPLHLYEISSVLWQNFRTQTANTNLFRRIKLVCQHKQVTQPWCDAWIGLHH
jgi:hypothetical protein